MCCHIFLSLADEMSKTSYHWLHLHKTTTPKKFIFFQSYAIIFFLYKTIVCYNTLRFYVMLLLPEYTIFMFVIKLFQNFVSALHLMWQSKSHLTMQLYIINLLFFLTIIIRFLFFQHVLILFRIFFDINHGNY